MLFVIQVLEKGRSQEGFTQVTKKLKRIYSFFKEIGNTYACMIVIYTENSF